MTKAVCLRFVKLFLLYCSLVRARNKLSRRSGRERNLFEVIRPQSPELYKGPLSDKEICPQPLGVTWTPEQPPSDAPTNSEVIVTLHIHGGAFVIGNGRGEDTVFLSRTLICHMGCTHVCSPQYRLSESVGGRFPTALQAALTAYLYLIREKSIPTKRIILSGDLAGGNLALGLLCYIHEHGKELDIPLPSAVTLWLPWVDVGAALLKDLGNYLNYKMDYLNKEFGRWGAAAVSGYGAIKPDSPYLSPLHHPFKIGADIPMFVQGRDKEVTYDDIKIT